MSFLTVNWHATGKSFRGWQRYREHYDKVLSTHCSNGTSLPERSKVATVIASDNLSESRVVGRGIR
jgi:hypothetical protein